MGDRAAANDERPEQAARAIRRVAVIFDDKLRPETTGTYCRRALEGLVEVTHINPTNLAGISQNGFDLYLRIDDGLNYDLPSKLHPSAWWAIDTHLDFDGYLAKAREFDFVFAAQRDGADRLRKEGIGSPVWLPLAADPVIHCRHEVAKQYDVTFVGNELPGVRTELLGLIRRRFLNSFIGQRYFDEMAMTYSSSRIVFNRSVRNDINMRVFEALACGSLLITNDLSDNGQSELFRSGVHLETYRDADELIDKIRYYLEHDELRERIAATGRAEVLAKHTYRHRMQTLLERVQASGVRVQSLGTSDQQSAISNQRFSSGPLPSALCSQPFRDRSYFDHVRPELLALVPDTAHRVLDIGCATGRLGERIRERQRAVVIGIEMAELAASEARTRLDEVIVGNVEQIEPAFDPNSFDCVVCGDILEHLEDTESLLLRIGSWLKPDGHLVASIPNVRHHSVVRSLLDGNWTYEPAGLLDRDHVRFFTRKEIERVLYETGFRIDRLQFVPGPGYDEWERQGRLGAVKMGRVHIGGLSAEEAEEFFVYQFLVVAQPDKNGKPTRSVSDTPAPVDEKPASNINWGSTPRRANPGAPGRNGVATSRRMRFTQNFITDFDQFDFRSEPFAFVRFGDGERAICEGRRVECQDGWTFDGTPTQFASDLNASLRFNDPDYFIGVSDSCCDRIAHEWYLKQIIAPFEQVTFANIFVNWNYRRFRQLDLSGVVIVSNGGGEFWVPDDLVHGNFDIGGLVTQLLVVDRPILLAAGPASCVIAHKYWLRADPARRQTIVDVGSAIDERTKGRKTRQYQVPGARTAELICTW